MRDLHLLNSHFGLMVIYAAGAMPFSIFLLTTFFRQIPTELQEAAEVEGAGLFTIYWKIMMPLVRPALATVGIFEFLHIWNDFFFPLVMLKSNKLLTIPVGLSVFFGEYSTGRAVCRTLHLDSTGAGRVRLHESALHCRTDAGGGQ